MARRCRMVSRMDRIAGIETEYGCLASGEAAHPNGDAWPVRVKNYLFRKMRAGVIDLHYRDYEEPPGNGGFLLNGGRIYLDMGHLEYASPECRQLRDVVAYDLAGDQLLQSALDSLGASRDRFLHQEQHRSPHRRDLWLSRELSDASAKRSSLRPALGALLAFLATRQIFTGAGRVGQANPLAFDFEVPTAEEAIDFQLSQRADHIVNDIYQWVQFNRAIINARDEPLADYRKYRRLHLLIGDSNMSPFANALKIGTTACILTLLEDGLLPNDLTLLDAVQATREISRDPSDALDRRIGRRRARSARSMCNGAATRWRSSISEAATKKPTGCSRAGAIRSTPCLTNRRR